MPAAVPRTTFAPVSEPRAEKQPGRVVFIDAMRLLALAQMVNGHTLDATMVDSLRESAWFPTYDYLRGMVSVAFMVAAGLAYHLTTFARFDPVRARAGRPKRVVRAFFLVAVGYAMRLSPELFASDPDVAGRALAYFLRVDVLHCIGFAILALEIITAWARTAVQARTAAAALGALMLSLAPWTSHLPLDDGNRAWLNWFSHEGSSFFPIAPWAAYPLFGAAIGGFLAPQEDGARRAPVRLLLASAGAFGLSLAIRFALPHLGDGIHPASSPAFFFEKLAALLALGVPLAFLVRNVRALPRPLEVLTGETLVVYVFHLLAIFAPHVGPGRAFRHALELGPAIGMALVMVVISFGVGLAAPEVRRRARALFAARRAVPDDAASAKPAS